MISQIVSIIALFVSLFTAWFTIFRRGRVRSTQPSFVAFRYDFVGQQRPLAKIFLRTMLFSTGKRVGSSRPYFFAFAKDRARRSFRFGATETRSLFAAAACSYPKAASSPIITPIHCMRTVAFRFSQGTYNLELALKLVGRKHLISVWTADLEIPSESLTRRLRNIRRFSSTGRLTKSVTSLRPKRAQALPMRGPTSKADSRLNTYGAPALLRQPECRLRWPGLAGPERLLA